jgi:hypothetical protein
MFWFSKNCNKRNHERHQRCHPTYCADEAVTAIASAAAKRRRPCSSRTGASTSKRSRIADSQSPESDIVLRVLRESRRSKKPPPTDSLIPGRGLSGLSKCPAVTALTTYALSTPA